MDGSEASGPEHMGNRMTVTQSVAETRALGEKLARQLRPGDVVLLEGE